MKNWFLEVNNKDNVFAPHVNSDVVPAKDILKKALEYAKQYPTEYISVTASARCRFQINDGKLYADNYDYGQFYLLGSKEDYIYAIYWLNVVNSEKDDNYDLVIEDKYKDLTVEEVKSLWELQLKEYTPLVRLVEKEHPVRTEIDAYNASRLNK